MSANPDESVHVAFRSGAFAGIAGPTVNTVHAHNEVVLEHGRVFLGKSGTPLGQERAALVSRAIGAGSVDFVFIKKHRGAFRVWVAPLAAILTGVKRVPLHLVPAYYRADAARIKTWFEIGQLRPTSESRLDCLVLVSNGRSLRQVLVTSRTTLMVVTDREGPK